MTDEVAVLGVGMHPWGKWGKNFVEYGLVAAREALAMGLADRVVPPGQARSAAEALAREIAALPQQCLRSDRASTLEGGWLGEGEAMANEFRRGMAVLAAPGTADGVNRFRGGAGRGGAPA